MRQKLSAPDAEGQSEQSENRDRHHAHSSAPQSDAHDQGHRNRHRDGENAPRAVGQRLHHHERQHRDQDDHDRQDADEREHTDAAADFFLHHLAQRLPAPPHGSEEHNHVVHAAAERRADQNPKRAREKSKLRRQDRTNQRSRPRDRGKVVAENHPAIGRDKIFAVILHHRRSGALVVQDQDLGRQPFAVETIADREGAKAGGDNPQRADLFAARKRQHDDRHQAQGRDGNPKQFFPDIHRLNLMRADEILGETKAC